MQLERVDHAFVKKNKIKRRGTLEDLKVFVLLEIDENKSTAHWGHTWCFDSDLLFLHGTKRAEIYILKEKRRRCLVTEGVNAFLTACEETSEPANSAERVMEIENISSDGVEDDNTFEKSN